MFVIKHREQNKYVNGRVLPTGNMGFSYWKGEAMVFNSENEARLFIDWVKSFPLRKNVFDDNLEIIEAIKTINHFFIA